MKIEEVIETIRSLNITEDEESLTFKSAVILLYGMTNGTVSPQKLKRATGYWWKEVYFIVNNFRANLVIVGYNWELIIVEDDLQNLIEITCLAMAGAGELVRISDAIKPEEKPFKWDEFAKKMEHCPTITVAREFLYRTVDKKTTPVIKERKETKEELPTWLIEKQQRIKAIAEKFDQHNS